MEKNGCYADILHVRNEELLITADAAGTEGERETDHGVKLRVHDGVQFHERAVSGFDEQVLRRAARELGKIKRRKPNMLELAMEPLEAEYSALGHKDVRDISTTDKLRDTQMLRERVLRKEFVDVRVRYSDFHESKEFVNSKRTLRQEINGCHVAIIIFVKGQHTRYHYDSFFDHGYERMQIPEKDIKRLVRYAKKVATAERLPPGKYHCLLSPHLSGLLAHESFGHGMEADTLVKGRGKAAMHLGRRLCGTHVSIADGPLQPGKHGFYFFDDEGWLATKTQMLRQGVVNHPITDAYSAARFGIARSSNGRAESFDRKVYARMTNTFFEPGTTKRTAMQRRIKAGLLLHTASGGMEDPHGWGIQVQGILAEKIVNGKATGKLYYEVGMSGYLPTFLNNIEDISKEWEITGSGRCGKGHKDWVRVAEGGPYLLIKDVMLS